MLYTIRHQFYNSKKSEKHPWRCVSFTLALLKSVLIRSYSGPHLENGKNSEYGHVSRSAACNFLGVYLRFLICTNGTTFPKASQLWIKSRLRWLYLLQNLYILLIFCWHKRKKSFLFKTNFSKLCWGYHSLILFIKRWFFGFRLGVGLNEHFWILNRETNFCKVNSRDRFWGKLFLQYHLGYVSKFLKYTSDIENIVLQTSFFVLQFQTSLYFNEPGNKKQNG